MSSEVQLVLTIASPIFLFGVVYGGVKVAINGMKEKIDSIHAIVTHEEYGNKVLNNKLKQVEEWMD